MELDQRAINERADAAAAKGRQGILLPAPLMHPAERRAAGLRQDFKGLSATLKHDKSPPRPTEPAFSWGDFSVLLWSAVQMVAGATKSSHLTSPYTAADKDKLAALDQVIQDIWERGRCSQ